MTDTNAVYVIAEAGVNHNGSLTVAKQLVDTALEAGANAVKFQSFVPELLVCKDTPQAQYQVRNTGEQGSQLNMLRRLALSDDEHKELMLYCQEL